MDTPCLYVQTTACYCERIATASGNNGWETSCSVGIGDYSVGVDARASRPTRLVSISKPAAEHASAGAAGGEGEQPIPATELVTRFAVPDVPRVGQGTWGNDPSPRTVALTENSYRLKGNESQAPLGNSDKQSFSEWSWFVDASGAVSIHCLL